MRFKVMKAYFMYCDSLHTEPNFDGLKDFNKQYGKFFR